MVGAHVADEVAEEDEDEKEESVEERNEDESETFAPKISDVQPAPQANQVDKVTAPVA